MYELLGITVVLAMLLTVNVVSTMMVTGVWRVFKGSLRHCTARTRAEILFVMRTGPPAVAIIWIAAFIIPSYLKYEPYSTNEIVSLKLGIIAIISAVGVGLAIWRGLRSWLATRNLLQLWLMNSTPIELEGVRVPAFKLDYGFPIIAVVGMLRPRLFIAEQVLTSLSAEELAAAIAHECGHLVAYDNCKRSLMRASRAALLMIPCGTSLDRAWSEASESAADEYAAQESSTLALNLASALVRIARMIPREECQELPSSVSAFLVGGEEVQGVKTRVRRLLELASTEPSQLVSNALWFRLMPWLLLTTILVTGLTIESRPQLLASVHFFIEHVVAILS
jgi:Zn-dependent protease with chaperone function